MTKDDIQLLRDCGITNKRIDKACDIVLAFVLVILLAAIIASIILGAPSTGTAGKQLSLSESRPTVEETAVVADATQEYEVARKLDAIEGQQH